MDDFDDSDFGDLYSNVALDGAEPAAADAGDGASLDDELGEDIQEHGEAGWQGSEAAAKGSGSALGADEFTEEEEDLPKDASGENAAAGVNQPKKPAQQVAGLAGGRELSFKHGIASLVAGGEKEDAGSTLGAAGEKASFRGFDSMAVDAGEGEGDGEEEYDIEKDDPRLQEDREKMAGGGGDSGIDNEARGGKAEEFDELGLDEEEALFGGAVEAEIEKDVDIHGPGPVDTGPGEREEGEGEEGEGMQEGEEQGQEEEEEEEEDDDDDDDDLVIVANDEEQEGQGWDGEEGMEGWNEQQGMDGWDQEMPEDFYGGMMGEGGEPGTGMEADALGSQGAPGEGTPGSQAKEGTGTPGQENSGGPLARKVCSRANTGTVHAFANHWHGLTATSKQHLASQQARSGGSRNLCLHLSPCCAPPSTSSAVFALLLATSAARRDPPPVPAAKPAAAAASAEPPAAAWGARARGTPDHVQRWQRGPWHAPWIQNRAGPDGTCGCWEAHWGSFRGLLSSGLTVSQSDCHHYPLRCVLWYRSLELHAMPGAVARPCMPSLTGIQALLYPTTPLPRAMLGRYL